MGMDNQTRKATGGRFRLMQAVKLLSLVAVGMLVMTMLLACGDEDEDIGNDGNNGSGGTGTATAQPDSTPTSDSGDGSTGTPTEDGDTGDGIEHPTSADEPILIISYEGGFVMPQTIITRLPLFVLLGDGTVVTEGPQIEIFPQPALPNLQAVQISEEGIQEILKAAEEAGLLDGDADYPIASIADAAYTVFRLTANGETTTVSAYALAEGEFSSPDLSPEQVEARKQLSDFLGKVTDLRAFLPEEAFVSEEQPYEITRLQTVFVPADSGMAPQPEEGLEQQELAWPGTTPIAELEPFMMPEAGMVCGVVEGDDLAPVIDALEQANQLTLWGDSASSATPGATPDADAEATQYYLFLRPLFPGETGCELPPTR